MRYRAALLGLVLLAAGCGGSGGKSTSAAAPSLKVLVKGPTAHPRANAKWPYSVTASDSNGERVSGKLTVQIVDPIGNAHTVTYDNTKKPVKDFPFHGTFHDYLQFPKQALGFTLTVKATVKSTEGTAVGKLGVKPK